MEQISVSQAGQTLGRQASGGQISVSQAEQTSGGGKHQSGRRGQSSGALSVKSVKIGKNENPDNMHIFNMHINILQNDILLHRKV